MSNTLCILVDTVSEKENHEALALSERLSIPLCYKITPSCSYYLVYTDNRRQLQQNPLTASQAEKPISVDFLHNTSIHRRISSITLKDPLSKAVGAKTGYRPSVLDATAGLGNDGVSLAFLGCQVVLVERSPIIYALLEDGFNRAKGNTTFSYTVAPQISLIHGDSTSVFLSETISPDVVYLDPMYPDTNKKLRNKKEMRLLRAVVGSDLDSSSLFLPSLEKSSKRVVVKRPKGSDPLVAKPTPSFTVKMKSGRFDVYLKDYL